MLVFSCPSAPYIGRFSNLTMFWAGGGNVAKSAEYAVFPLPRLEIPRAYAAGNAAAPAHEYTPSVGAPTDSPKSVGAP